MCRAYLLSAWLRDPFRVLAISTSLWERSFLCVSDFRFALRRDDFQASADGITQHIVWWFSLRFVWLLYSTIFGWVGLMKLVKIIMPGGFSRCLERRHLIDLRILVNGILKNLAFCSWFALTSCFGGRIYTVTARCGFSQYLRGDFSFKRIELLDSTILIMTVDLSVPWRTSFTNLLRWEQSAFNGEENAIANDR